MKIFIMLLNVTPVLNYFIYLIIWLSLESF